MRERLFFGDAVMGAELLVGDGCGVRLVPVDIREIPTKEHFQLKTVNEVRGICRDGIEEPLIVFVSL